METRNNSLVQSALLTNKQLARLYSEHRLLDATVAKMEKRNYLTDQESQELRKLKLRKLARREEISRILKNLQ